MNDKTLLIVSHKKHQANLANGDVKVDGGFLPITNEIAKHFRRVILCVPVFGEPDTPSRQRYASNVQIRPLPVYRTRFEFLRRLPAIWRELWSAAGDVDIVYAMGPNDMGGVGLAVARLAGKPVFASFDTDRAAQVATKDYGSIKRTAKTLFNRLIIYPYFRLMAKSAPAFITGDMFLGRYPAWHQWIKTTHTDDQVVPVSLHYAHPRKPKLVFAGRLSPEKNVSALIEAISLLHHQGIAASLSIIGDGPDEQKLRYLVEQHELKNSITFVGRIPSSSLLESRFLGAEILVLPSLEERQGKVLLEAMACGIPVIASNAGGIPSVIEHRRNGILFDPRSVHQLAKAIELLTCDRGLYLRLAKEGSAFARRHTLEAGVQKLVDVVEGHYFADGLPIR